MARTFELTTPLGTDVLLFHRMSVTEELGRLGDYRLDMVSERGDVNLDKILGQRVTIKMEVQDGTRYFTAYVTRFAQAGMYGRYYVYRAVLKPWLWFLTRTADCRIFQQKTVPDILKEVLGEHPLADFKFELTGSFRKREYCVQYRETDFNFLSRLMEEEGIYYYFRHGERNNTLVLANAYSAHSPVPGYAQIPFIPPERFVRAEQDHIPDWDFEREVEPGKYVLEDYDFEKPSVDLTVKTAVQRGYDHSDAEVYDYPGEYLTTAEGDHYVQARIEELQAQYELAHGSSNARGLTVGYLFKLTGHPRTDQNREYLVVAATHQLQASEYESMDSGGATYGCSFTALASRQAFRPKQSTPRPTVQGPQTAIVVGPSGDEIYTDKYGRVKVQFHWDRLGKKDENSSCWMRVSHPWAGKNWGAIHIPRIGQEVIVDFLEGDPDQPIITGRVYNAEQMPPWALPGNMTQSGILTRSSKGGSGANANAIRFEDKKGSEQLWIHAEKNQDIEVENDETHWVGHDRTKTIDHDETTHVKHDRTETVDNNETITIHGMRTETVDKNETITIHMNRTETVDINESISIGANRSITVGASETATVALQRTHTVGVNETITVGAAQEITVGAAQAVTVGANQTVNVGNSQSTSVGSDQSWDIGSNQSETIGKNQSSKVGEGRSVDVGKDDSLKVGKNLVIDAGESVTIKTGSASITMKKDGTIQIKGKDITIDGSGKINVKASSDVVIKGSKVGIN